jgi:hypothetical protein
MECKDCDFWGMTASPEAVPHLQSYFLSFKSSLLREDRFRQFWASVLPYSDKRNVVASYEVGLTTWLREGGFDGHVAFPLPAKPISRWESLKIGRLFHSKVRHDRNPILSYPDLLIHAGLPYVKMDLIRNNSQKLRLDRIRALLEAEGWDPDALG